MQIRESGLISKRQHHRVGYLFVISLWFLAFLLLSGRATAQTTCFTYQGKLAVSGAPANGTFDFQFKLFDALSNGNQDGITLILEDVQVTNDIFVVNLDFGAATFRGPERFIDIGVRNGSDTGALTTLTPRQQVTATPFAIKSLHATNAAIADSLSAACIGCVTGNQTGSVNGGTITGTIPVAGVPPGSANYIQMQ